MKTLSYFPCYFQCEAYGSCRVAVHMFVLCSIMFSLLFSGLCCPCVSVYDVCVCVIFAAPVYSVFVYLCCLCCPCVSVYEVYVIVYLVLFLLPLCICVSVCVSVLSLLPHHMAWISSVRSDLDQLSNQGCNNQSIHQSIIQSIWVPTKPGAPPGEWVVYSTSLQGASER